MFLWQIKSMNGDKHFYLSTLGVCCAFLKDFIHLFLERGEGREIERERNIHVCESKRKINWLFLLCSPMWMAHTPGTHPDQELNKRPFALQDDAQPTGPCWAGRCMLCFLQIHVFHQFWKTLQFYFFEYSLYSLVPFTPFRKHE